MKKMMILLGLLVLVALGVESQTLQVYFRNVTASAQVFKPGVFFQCPSSNTKVISVGCDMTYIDGGPVEDLYLYRFGSPESNSREAFCIWRRTDTSNFSRAVRITIRVVCG